MARKPRITKSKAAELIVPQTDDQARAIIARLGDGARRLAEQAELTRQQIDSLRGQLKAVADVIDGEAALQHKALQIYFEAHAERLTEGGRRKTVDWPEGQMGHRLSKPKVRLLQGEELVIDALEARALDVMLRVKVEVDRQALLADLLSKEPLVSDLAKIEQREEFFVAPAAADAPPALEVTHEL
ncbi:MAG: hypothetical protein E6R12_12565 [Sphingomonadales bacterium]|nr:MAG: hypothetical protein E6R12_12565 [Sphingomonadales bacterium]